MNTKMMGGLIFVALAAGSSGANAAITSETIINFNPNMNSSSYSGFANNAPLAGGNCAGSGSTGCFYEDGMVVGIVEDTSNPTAHFHRNGLAANRMLGYHSDSSGIYIRAQDGTAFNLVSMDFIAPAGDENPDANGVYGSFDLNGNPITVTGVAGPNDYWEILGYGSAVNPGLDAAADSGSWIARQTVTNGFSGTLALSSAFQNISAFWIHYTGYQQTPQDGKQFGMEMDNIKVNTAVAAVPVPAAVWMFGSGLLGLLSFGRKKNALAA